MSGWQKINKTLTTTITDLNALLNFYFRPFTLLSIYSSVEKRNIWPESLQRSFIQHRSPTPTSAFKLRAYSVARACLIPPSSPSWPRTPSNPPAPATGDWHYKCHPGRLRFFTGKTDQGQCRTWPSVAQFTAELGYIWGDPKVLSPRHLSGHKPVIYFTQHLYLNWSLQVPCNEFMHTRYLVVILSTVLEIQALQVSQGDPAFFSFPSSWECRCMLPHPGV